MRVFLTISIAFSFLSIAIAQTTSPSTDHGEPPGNRGGSLDSEKVEGKLKKKPEQIMDTLKQGNPIANIIVEGDLDVTDSAIKNLKFSDMIFDGDLHISGNFDRITFERCQFKQSVDFYLLTTQILSIQNCKFLGAVWLNIDVVGFTLRICDFDKAPNLVGAKFPTDKRGAINITRLATKEPIKIFWSQFGDKWLGDLKGSLELGGDTEQANIRQVLTELEFWKDNFTKLGHPRDAAEVNYEINEFAQEKHITFGPYSADWWVDYQLKWLSRYGASPYRPIWVGLIIICIFTLIFWVADPFVAKDEKQLPQKPRTPRAIFSLMYSIDTFIPVVDVTKVKDWGWEIAPSYRWVTVFERILGLLIFYASAYSLTYYVL